MESSLEIEERAAEWHAKRDSGNWSEDDRLRFEEWLNASTAHRVAFLRQEAAWEQALRLQALSGGTPRGTVPSPEDWRLSPFLGDQRANVDSGGTLDASAGDPHAVSTGGTGASNDKRVGSARSWRMRLSHALAASLLLAVLGGVAWYMWPSGPTYRTAVGEFASVPMRDGSKITLNTDSQIRLAVSETERRVELEQGEAFFEVAHDSTRPFIVSAGNKRVVAVGTKFSVRRIDNEVRVFVTEGKVRIEDDELESRPQSKSSTSRAATQSWLDRGGARRTEQRGAGADILVSAGGIARTGDAGFIVQQNAQPEVDDYLSWRTGYLVFRETPLADAVAEFNRYNEEKIFIQDPAIAAIRFSGKIRPTSSEPFLRLLEEAFPIHAERTGTRIFLTDSRH